MSEINPDSVNRHSTADEAWDAVQQDRNKSGEAGRMHRAPAPIERAVEATDSVAGLLPCPFCGGNFIVCCRTPDKTNWFVMCNEDDDVCPREVKTLECDTLEGAKGLWNTRADSALADERDALRDAVVKARDTFDDFIVPLRIMKRGLMADACQIARDAMNAALASTQDKESK